MKKLKQILTSFILMVGVVGVFASANTDIEHNIEQSKEQMQQKLETQEYDLKETEKEDFYNVFEGVMNLLSEV